MAASRSERHFSSSCRMNIVVLPNAAGLILAVLEEIGK